MLSQAVSAVVWLRLCSVVTFQSSQVAEVHLCVTGLIEGGVQFVCNPFAGGQLMNQEIGSCVSCESVEVLGLKLRLDYQLQNAVNENNHR